MRLNSVILFLAAVNVWPSNGSALDNLPESSSVVEALSDSSLYEELVRLGRSPDQLRQSSLKNVFSDDKGRATCGVHPLCPAFEGETRHINGRQYNLYCINAPWGIYRWLPKSRTLDECERKCHDDSYDCNGLTFYPLTGACSVIYSKDAAPYIWDNGYQKIGAIPAKSDVAFGPGMVCPLPGSNNQVWDFEGKKYQFKMSCRNQFNVGPASRRQLGTVKNVDECGERCGRDNGCQGFHYYQPYFPGGPANGARNCELITDKVGEDDWVPVHRPNQYISGLRVRHSDCGDIGWNRDEKGNKKGKE